MGPIYLFMERSFEPPARFEQVEPERGGRLGVTKMPSLSRYCCIEWNACKNRSERGSSAGPTGAPERRSQGESQWWLITL